MLDQCRRHALLCTLDLRRARRACPGLTSGRPRAGHATGGRTQGGSQVGVPGLGVQRDDQVKGAGGALAGNKGIGGVAVCIDVNGGRRVLAPAARAAAGMHYCCLWQGSEGRSHACMQAPARFGQRGGRRSAALSSRAPAPVLTYQKAAASGHTRPHPPRKPITCNNCAGIAAGKHAADDGGRTGERTGAACGGGGGGGERHEQHRDAHRGRDALQNPAELFGAAESRRHCDVRVSDVITDGGCLSRSQVQGPPGVSSNLEVAVSCTGARRRPQHLFFALGDAELAPVERCCQLVSPKLCRLSTSS